MVEPDPSPCLNNSPLHVLAFFFWIINAVVETENFRQLKIVRKAYFARMKILFTLIAFALNILQPTSTNLPKLIFVAFCDRYILSITLNLFAVLGNVTLQTLAAMLLHLNGGKNILPCRGMPISHEEFLPLHLKRG